MVVRSNDEYQETDGKLTNSVKARGRSMGRRELKKKHFYSPQISQGEWQSRGLFGHVTYTQLKRGVNSTISGSYLKNNTP